jgi:hypothetical protein
MSQSRSSAAIGLTIRALCAPAACGPSPANPAAASCPADRAVVLASRADVARVAGCTELRGVAVRTGGVLDLSALRALTAISGDLVIGPTVGIEQVTLGALRRVDGAIRVASNGVLQGLYLPRLERGGDLAIDGNAALTTISLPRLTTLGGALHVTDNASLEWIDLSALASVGRELVLAGAPRLALLEAEQLQRAAAVQIEAPSLPSEIADQLRAAATAR